MNTPKIPQSPDYTPDVIAKTEQMIAESNAKRALGGLAYVEAQRDEHEDDVAGTFPGSTTDNVISLFGEASLDETDELEASVHTHPSNVHEMPGRNRGALNNPLDQPPSQAEINLAWSGMTDEQKQAQIDLNKVQAEKIKQQIRSRSTDDQKPGR